MENRKKHWDSVWSGRAIDELSWFQAFPGQSLAMIANSGIALDEPLIDVGGGASCLAEHLLERGHTDITVLDLSAAALRRAQGRLGERSGSVRWIEADVRTFRPARAYRLWHDRALFHFLTDAGDRDRYRAALRASLAPGGTLILATFAPEGPPRCSGLEIMRYDSAALGRELGPDFALREKALESHRTPAGRVQRFTWCRFRRRDSDG